MKNVFSVRRILSDFMFFLRATFHTQYRASDGAAGHVLILKLFALKRNRGV